MAKQYKSVIDLLMEQVDEQQGEVYKASFKGDAVKFGFPEHMTEPMNKQLQRAIVSPGQGNGKQKPVELNSTQQVDKGQKKQLSLPGSSTIQQAAYWPNREYLVVSFKSGHTYDYKGVELVSVLLWEQASSAGSWFYYNIRTRYPYSKLG